MPQQAVLSGDIKRFDATKRMDPFDCVKRENQGLTIELNRHWVLMFRLEGQGAGTARDTPTMA